MAPASREVSKTTPKSQRSVQRSVQRSASKSIMSASAKGRSSPATAKKNTTIKNNKDKIPIYMNDTTVETRKQTSSVVNVSPTRRTKEQRENKTVQTPGSVVKSTKKLTRKYRPKAAHSGVPVPEKMKLLFVKSSDVGF